MARRLIWAPRALDDLEEIVGYIEARSPTYARAVAKRFFEKAEDLAGTPGIGRRLPEYSGPEDVREIFVHSWRLIYAASPEQVRILAIIHGARLLDNAPPIDA